MQSYKLLLQEAGSFVKNLLASRLGKDRFFHNVEHTVLVVKSCQALAENEAHDSVDYAALIVAAWFHDTGYIITSAGHEFESVRIVTEFLESFNVDEHFGARVAELILSTRMQSTATHKLAEVLRDADLSHLGSHEYKRWEFKLRRELEVSDGILMTDRQWLEQNIYFFKTHGYSTERARQLWTAQKNQNLKILEQNLATML